MKQDETSATNVSGDVIRSDGSYDLYLRVGIRLWNFSVETVVTRKDDVLDLFDKAATGWIAPPTKPILVVESKKYTVAGFLKRPPTDGVIVVKKKYKREREKLSLVLENRVWNFPCVIILPEDDTLQLVFDQAVEVADRYTNAPWSTSALGTSTTYDFAGVEEGIQDERAQQQRPVFVMDIIVQLAEFVVPVKIA